MNQSTVTLLDLPIEILHIILKKLDNMDVLYSLLGIDNQRLDTIVLDKTFTKSLNFVLRTTTDDLMPIIGSMLDRFCIDILPKIDYNVKSLTLHSESMERILAADFPNLSELRLYNVNNNTISRYFTNESPFRRIIQEQITDLIFLYKYDNRILLKWEYSNDVSDIGSIKLLSRRNLPLTAYSSSTICKLCVHVNRFEDCLALLDGRLKQLTTFIVTIENHDYRTSINYKKLPIECGELTNQMCLLGCLIALVDETWKASDLDLIQHMNVDMLKLPRLLNDTYLEEFTDLQKQPNAKSSGSPCSIKHLRKKNFVDTLKRQLHAQVSGKQAGGIESAAVVAFVK
ncbi:unnamed protein product [Rotaria sp. Silwood2]|nr:unnamed protein product [Rotaria sp. Silwood2]CAF4454958.1 unnamed protein product [Rotaria sp. Silwood2]